MDLTVSKINRLDQFIISAQQHMRENKFKNDYANLYKYLIGYSLQSLTTDNEDTYWQGINALESYFKKIQNKKEPCTFVNQDCDWTQVGATFKKEWPFLRSLVKLYVPVKYTDLSRIARILFDYLLDNKKSFFFKISQRDRTDNICIWIMRSEFEATIEFLQNLNASILPAPLFCPEYKNIGVTRELSESYNQAIASTLFRYIQKTENPTFADYVIFLNDGRRFKSEFKFDKAIVIRSLKCIAYNQCPAMSNEFNIVDFDCDDDE